MSDELVSKLKKYDIKAFEEFVSLYEKKIYNYAYGFTLNREDSLDITQEVFLKVYKNIDKFKEKSSISTWIYRITSNVCIDFARKAKPNKIVSITDENLDIIQNIKDTKILPEDFLVQTEMSEEIISSLNGLDYDAKQIIVMRDILGLTYSEIGEILKLEEGTVKSRIARSRKKLRSIILEKRNFSNFMPSK